MTDMTILPLDSIDADPDQPRKRFAPEPLAELAASLASVGLLEPVIVRPVGGRFVLIAGERRTRAARMAGWDTIPAIVRDVDAATAFELSMIENIVRADMNPIEEAAGYQRLVEAGMPVETIAERLGKTAQDIRFRLQLLRLDEPIRDLVAAGQMGVWDGWHVARLTVEGQHRVIRAMRDGQLTQAGSVRRFALAVFEQEAQIAAFPGDGDLLTSPPVAKRANTAELLADYRRIVKMIGSLETLVVDCEVTDEVRMLAAEAKRRASRLDTLLAGAQVRQLVAAPAIVRAV